MTTLPSPRHFVTSLISATPKPLDSNCGASNQLQSAEDSKDLFLTLHVLFPNELLPALDLLDRGLITRLRLQRTNITAEVDSQYPAQPQDVDHEATADEIHATQLCTYYVRSGQQHLSRGNTSRYRNEHTTYYEVRLKAWSCSCPAFTFSAFPAATTAPAELSPDQDSEDDVQEWRFGGLTRGSDMPVCKHLLACVLIEHADAFSHLVDERLVSAEELAGWAAGWGD